ncbi:iron chelate uptake ABC transporter family permease subunit [Leucothrix arctica]|uniref:High-affinity zinc uptake system membrane protein ZnuB n=1 Tax=Leucothrix arctica TaxID=1481894 RepID=A0A317CEG6_9GAMM|nr:iron chelate uptake ABC transporter family permease subunit [Leucothrix arctica]PWQ94512.1 hypothetical protein DKT75_14540 [Leucothrix arctica]
MDEFIIRAMIAGSLVAAVAGLLGVFVVWRRMAFFGDTLSHSALLGVAIGMLLNIGFMVGVVASTLLVGIILFLFQRQQRVSNDALLGILAHSGLSLGLIALSFVQTQNVNVEEWLFGDVLSVTWDDVTWIALTLVLVVGVMAWLWRPLLTLTVDEELARVEGVNAGLVNLVFVGLVALLVATAMQVVGALLITALLIIPASAARSFAKTPEQMALFAAVIGVVSVFIGITASLLLDTPAGPSIVFSSAMLFFMSQITRVLKAA